MSSGRLRARINEIWAQIGALRAKREAMMRGAANGSAPGAVEWAVVDHESLDQVAHVSGARQDCLLLKLAHTRLLQILTTQQKGLNHVSETLVSDSQALDVLLKGLEGVQLVGVKNANGLRPRESL
jgi:nuclear pore complex protein Nup54